jgi:monoamine oxidase
MAAAVGICTVPNSMAAAIGIYTVPDSMAAAVGICTVPLAACLRLYLGLAKALRDEKVY